MPDTVLLQAIACLAPGDVCAAAKCCSQWAETVTNSEAWLWSAVGAVGLPPRIFELLERWAGAVHLTLRYALQLWLCRAHLWGGSAWTGVEAHDPLVTSVWYSPPCDSAPVCCSAWLGDEGAPSERTDGGLGAAIGFASGVLAFCRLAVNAVPAHGLQGLAVRGMEEVAKVRAAHGYHLITAVRPVGGKPHRVVSAGLDGLLRIWDPTSAEEVVQINTELQRGANDVTVSPGEDAQLLCCGDDGNAFLYNASAPMGTRAVRNFQGHTAPVYCSAWTSASTCTTGGFDRRTLVWDCRAPRGPILALPARQHVYSVAPFGMGGDSLPCLAVGLADGTVVQWDLRRVTKEPFRELRGHGGAVESMATLPGDVVATASADGTLRLWDMGRKGELAWVWSGGGALTSVTAVLEDALLVVGLGTAPTVLALDYGRAAPHVPEVLDRLQLPTLQPWRRSLPGAPPEGHGRHLALVQRRRLQRAGSWVAGQQSGVAAGAPAAGASRGHAARGAFDRCQKGKPIPLGATGAAHRTFLFGSRR